MTPAEWAALGAREKEESVSAVWEVPHSWRPFIGSFSPLDWTVAGQLLDRLRAECWRWSLMDKGDEATCEISKTVRRIGRPGGNILTLRAVGASGPDAIALAYVLAAEAKL